MYIDNASIVSYSVRMKCEKYVKPVETTDLISGIQPKTH